jgi:hypothetical protein
MIIDMEGMELGTKFMVKPLQGDLPFCNACVLLNVDCRAWLQVEKMKTRTTLPMWAIVTGSAQPPSTELRQQKAARRCVNKSQIINSENN